MAFAQVKYLSGALLGKKKIVNAENVKPALNGLHFDQKVKYHVGKEKAKIIFVAGKYFVK